MRVLVSAAVALSLLASGCGSEEAGKQSEARPTVRGEGGAFPVTIDAANGKVTIPRPPRRIVSLSPTATEMLFAIGAGDRVVAVDASSNYPPAAPRTDLSGLQPNVEAVAGYNPDLVVVSNDSPTFSRALGALKIPLLLQPAPATLDGSYAQLEQLGAATGNLPEAAEVVASMRSEIGRIEASVPKFEEPPTYYHELDQTYFTATSKTFIGHVYGLLGLRNIADRADEAGSGYPQLSAEFIIEADPDVIFLADTKCCKQTAETIARRPGWNEITAVKTGAVVELDDDVASRWGPRVVDFLRVVARRVSRLEPANT